MRNTFVLGIEIHNGRLCYTLGLSRKAYINKVLERFSMQIFQPKDVQSLKVIDSRKINVLKV